MTTTDRAAALDALYATLPALDCRGLCEESCGPIGASRAELERLDAAGVDVTAPRTDLTCPALSTTFGTGRCSVYAIRPTVCRLWGAVASMPRPHGCEPAGGRLSDAEGHAALVEADRIGGRDHHRLEGLLEALSSARGGIR